MTFLKGALAEIAEGHSHTHTSRVFIYEMRVQSKTNTSELINLQSVSNSIAVLMAVGEGERWDEYVYFAAARFKNVNQWNDSRLSDFYEKHV